MNEINFYEAVAIVCCGVTGGVWGSCFFSAIIGLFVDEEELVLFVVELLQEELVGVLGAFVVKGTGVEEFWKKD